MASAHRKAESPVSKSPAFQFYPDDFLGSSKVAVMTPQEIGVYVLLLCMDWNGVGFVFNPKLLARFCRMPEPEFVEAWEVVRECFEERDGRLYNPRLERERVKQAAYSAKQKAASDARWDTHRTSHGMPTGKPRVSSPFPSPAPATTGGRTRPFNGTTNDNVAATSVHVPPTPCGDGCELIAPEGAKRFVPRHVQGCPNA